MILYLCFLQAFLQIVSNIFILQTSYVHIGALQTFKMSNELTLETLASYKENFLSSTTTRLAQNVCTRSDPIEACLTRK